MNSVGLSVDITLHVLILFAFLSAFFFFYIAKLEKDNLRNISSSAIDDNTKTILDYIAKLENRFPKDVSVNWNSLRKWASNLAQSSQGETKSIGVNNRGLLKTSIIIISVLFVVLICLIVWAKYMGYDINLKHILIMNVIIFGLAGLCEFLFFQKVASKYIPVTPDIAINEVLNTLKVK